MTTPLATAVLFLGVVAVTLTGCTHPAENSVPQNPEPSSSASLSGTTPAAGPPPLFTSAPAAAAGQPVFTAQGAVKRARYVTFHPSLLPGRAARQKLDLTFFDDAHFVATITHMDAQALLTSWSGTLDSPRSTFVAVRSGDIYSVTASTVRGTFTMVQTPAGLYQVEEVDQPNPTASDMVEPQG